MASRKPGRPAHSYNQAYVQGSAARKLNTQPERPRPSREPRQSRGINHTIWRNQEKALYMDLPYVILLTVAAICTLYLCVNYLRLQSSINARIQNIEAQETKLENLKAENDALEIRINTYVDLDYIYKVATEELGMVYANKDQVLLYNKSESEYVRQYEDIPRYK